MSIDYPAFLYPLSFALAHIVSWGILLLYGVKHKFPKFQWLLIIATGYILFTIGSQLFAVNIESLTLLFTTGVWPVSLGKSFIVGLLFAVPAMLLLKRILGFNYAIFEPYAFSIPIGLAIQRIGCLAAGCCYGKPSALPWAVSYNYGHSVHYNQWLQGLIENHQLQSLSLHPVQVYEGILCLLIFSLIFFLYHKKWLQNQLIYVFLLLYAMARFVVEFFRAGSAHTFGLNSYQGMNSIQYVMLALALVLTFILVKKNIQKYEVSKVANIQEESKKKEIIWYLLLFSLVLFTANFFYNLELLLLGIILIPASAHAFWHIFKSVTVPRFRIATVCLFVLGFFLMSQNKPENTTNAWPVNYHIISVGGNAGYDNMTRYSQGCDGTKTQLFEVKEKYNLFGAGYQYVKEFNPVKRITFGVSGAYGSIQERFRGIQNIGLVPDQTFINYEVSPFIKYENKKFGIGLGVVAGDFNLFRQSTEFDFYQQNPSSQAPSLLNRNFRMIPSLHLRYGNMGTWWGEFNYGNRFPGISPANEFEIMIGIRGNKGNLVRIGTSAYHAIVVRPSFNIGESIILDPYVSAGGAMFSNKYMNRFGLQGGINLHYKIRAQKKK